MQRAKITFLQNLIKFPLISVQIVTDLFYIPLVNLKKFSILQILSSLSERKLSEKSFQIKNEYIRHREIVVNQNIMAY
jgi:hypothetical protein